MLNAVRLDVDRAMLLVIDLQEKLLPLIPDHDEIIAATIKLIRGAALFELPVLVTEQYPQGIGSTDARVSAELESVNASILHKTAFSCCGDDAVRDKLRDIDREQIIVCGIETHVCVQQTALDLLTMDHQVFICADAVSARGRLQHDMGLQRMFQLGAAPTTVESVLFELCGQCDTERFKTMLPLIKGN